MITVKLYGLLRVESGIRQREMQAQTVLDALDQLAREGISRKELLGCVILINGRSATKKSKLRDGDTVVLMSPVAGG